MADPRTLTIRLSTTLATTQTRYNVSGATFRCAFQTTSHTVSEVDIPASGSHQLPPQTKFVMLGTEDTTVNVRLTKGGEVITLPLDQVMLLPGAFASHDKIELLNTSSIAAVNVRFILM